MKNFLQKIINSAFAAVFAFGIIAMTHYVTENDSRSLSASILDGLTPGELTAIEFVTPKGSVYPVNGVVTINSVFVNITDAAATDGNVSGTDLANSFITFANGATACPAGTVFEGNRIILPSTFATACTVQIDVPGTASISTTDLRIEPVSCATLQTSILLGQGAGFEEIDSSDLGSFAVSSAFDFGNVSDPVNSIDLTYPSTAVNNAKTFQIHMDFVPDVSTDAINGIGSRAEIVSNNGTGVYEIKVRSEGTGSEAQTALNFMHVFNDLLGADTPFVAYPQSADPEKVILQATEMGVHPNAGYTCILDGTQVSSCFSGGADGTGEGVGVLTTPLTLDNEILQGDTALAFASNSAGEIQWVSSHPSILEVTTLSESLQQGEGIPDFVDTLLDDAVATETVTIANGAYNVTNCQKQFDENNDFVSETCSVQATVPVKYNISGINYTTNVSIEDEVVAVTVQGSQLNGNVTGTATYTSGGGMSMNLTGTVTGTVTGSVTGQFAGTVTGQIQAPISGSTTLTGQGNTELTPALIKANLTAITPVEGTLTDIPGTFVSTVKKQEEDISHVAVLSGKRPGTTLLTAIDAQNCIASFEVEVIEKKVILQMVGRKPGDVLDVSDTLQINAFAGGANQELEELENITASSGIEWFSSNEEVASVDQTGLLTALRPGVTNITARYDTGDAEIGTIESNPLSVTVNKISGLRVTFDKETQDKLENSVVEAAKDSVIIAIHNPEAAGQNFVIEGQTVAITLPAGTYANNLAKVTAIAGALNTSITALVNSLSQPVVQVTTIDGFPGMLILKPLNQSADADSDNIEDIDENGIMDVTTTGLEKDIAILPTFDNNVPLPASETFGLQVIAEYDNGATKLLAPTQFNWVNTPVNYLEQASLDTGLIKLGSIAGTSTVLAQFENADGSVVQSNYLTITVDAGPKIEYVRRIGSDSVLKGSRIRLQAKVTDVDTVADIASIQTSLVFSNKNTYQGINDDADAIWFSAVPFLSQVTVVDQSPEDDSDDGETESASPQTPVQPASLQFRTYEIPVDIPVDQNLFDGVYKLILSISDTSNHTLNHVYPIRIGQIGGGDVNGDGVTTMVDVILAFQIASGILPTPTPSQRRAADVDGVNGVTLVDVILLFNKVTK